MASSSAAEFMYVCLRKLWMADAWGIFSKVAWAMFRSSAVGARKRPVRGAGESVVCVVSGEGVLLYLRFFTVLWLCVCVEVAV